MSRSVSVVYIVNVVSLVITHQNVVLVMTCSIGCSIYFLAHVLLKQLLTISHTKVFENESAICFVYLTTVANLQVSIVFKTQNIVSFSYGFHMEGKGSIVVFIICL